MTVVASVQYRCHADTAEDAFYKLSQPREQIKAYVFDGMERSGYGGERAYVFMTVHDAFTVLVAMFCM